MQGRNKTIIELKKRDKRNRLSLPTQPTVITKLDISNTIKRGELITCVILLVLSAVLSAKTQNRIQLHIMKQRLITEGVNYDGFREMPFQKSFADDMNKRASTRQQEKAEDYFTLKMLLWQNNIWKKKISDKDMNYLLQSIINMDYFKELKGYYQAILRDIKVFPVAADLQGEYPIAFDDSWNSYRSYGGKRRHEGTDLMAKDNQRGVHCIVSSTDGIVEKLGWLEQGGYRVGIRGTEGAYFYYAHLDSYAKGLEVGDKVLAGDFLGYMGDSGYGQEGTVGKFDVHLHFGIYVETPLGEMSVNPYHLLLYLYEGN